MLLLQSSVLIFILISRQNESTEGCSNLKSTEKRQVQDRLVSTVKVGQDQLSGGVGVLCSYMYAAPVVNVLWKPRKIRFKVRFGNKVQICNRVKNWRSI